MNNEDFRNSIIGQIQNRASSLEKDLNFTNIFSGSISNYSSHYHLYAVRALGNNKCEYVSTKVDVEDVLQNIQI